MKISFRPIGIIHTPFKTKENMPIQGSLFPEAKGKVEVFGEYSDGLLDLDGFSHIILLYVFHKSKGYKPRAKPFLDDKKHGVFAIRSPNRPNPIGFTVVKLGRVEGNELYVSGVDMLDGTPLLDIKPYISDIDAKTDVRVGWIGNKMVGKIKSDDRFS